MIRLLIPHFRVVCFDMPGFGFALPTADHRHGLRRTLPESIRECLLQTKILRFGDCGHFSDLEQSARYTEAIIAHMAKLA